MKTTTSNHIRINELLYKDKALTKLLTLLHILGAAEIDILVECINKHRERTRNAIEQNPSSR